MTSQATLWLYPILVLSTVSLIFRLRLPWQWSWGFILQCIPLIVCALLGLTIGPDWMYAIVGWSLVFLLYLPPRLFYSSLQRHITTLDADELRRSGRMITLLFWGLSGRFWKEMSEALALFVERKPEEANAILTKWQNQSGLPKSVALIPGSYKLIGNGIMWNWDVIIADYERLRAEGKIPSAMLLSAARAYAESGNFAAAAQCLKETRLPEANLPLNTLALTLLPFFALIGARMQTDALLSILAEKPHEFPKYTQLYWLGRCLWAQGHSEDAKATLAKAMSISKSPLFQYRIETQLKKLDGGETFAPDEESKQQHAALIDEIWSIFARSAFVQEIISPRRRSVAVILLIFLNLLAYSPIAVFKLAAATGAPPAVILTADALANSAINIFALIPQLAINGEYWRFISYLFLHAHETHLALNVIGLYWFGRVAENIFGTSRFLAIYFVGGLLSGVAHALLCPEQTAVGASGAVMAVFGAVGAGIYRLKARIPESIWKLEISWLGGLALAQIVLDQIIPHVAAFAHLGGLLGGLAIGLLLSIRTPSTKEVDGTQEFIAG